MPSGTGDVPAEVGPYTLLLHENSPDGDDQIAEAVLMSPGDSGRAGRVSRTYDVDMYRFTASAGRPVAIDLDAPAADPWNSVLRVFDAAGKFNANRQSIWDMLPRNLPNNAFSSSVLWTVIFVFVALVTVMASSMLGGTTASLPPYLRYTQSSNFTAADK